MTQQKRQLQMKVHSYFFPTVRNPSEFYLYALCLILVGLNVNDSSFKEDSFSESFVLLRNCHFWKVTN